MIDDENPKLQPETDTLDRNDGDTTDRRESEKKKGILYKFGESIENLQAFLFQLLIPPVALIKGVSLIIKEKKWALGSFYSAAGIAGFYLVWLFIAGEQSPEVQFIKNNSFDWNPGMTIGKSIEQTMRDPQWEVLEDESGNRYVSVKGKVKYSNKKANLTLIFFVDLESGSFNLEGGELDEEELNQFELYIVASSIFGEG